MRRRLGLLFFVLAMASLPHGVRAEAAAAPVKPLLVINFNQKNVYFDRAVSQAVTAAEPVTPKVIYTVVSYLPAGVEAMSPEEETNVRKIVERMQSHGVTASRIQVMSQAYPAGMDAPSYQKVAIFVK